MSTTNSLVSEMLILRASVEAHRAKIIAAQEARDEAVEAANIPVVYGRYDLDFKNDAWRYPAVAEAMRVAEALADDSGYFWACSRLSDLERLLGAGWSSQLLLRTEDNSYVPTLRGGIPEAHESVATFLVAA